MDKDNMNIKLLNITLKYDALNKIYLIKKNN